MPEKHALYLHIPFCRHRCAYCDFNTYAGQDALLPAYAEALCREIEWVGDCCPERLPSGSIFFGGGTPSLMPAESFVRILNRLREKFCIENNAEISLEANPGTVTEQSLRQLRSLGFNRISFGVQSFHAVELRLLERIHDAQDALAAFEQARRAGFANINLDLIYGLPRQNLEQWRTSLQQAVALQPEHLSLYALTIERGTPFHRRVEKSVLPHPEPDLAADMYEWAMDYLNEEGYRQYEISNWSKGDSACRHNLHVWRNQPYLGFGAGAHGFAGGKRTANVLRIKTYIERMRSRETMHAFPKSPACAQVRRISRREEMQETMMLGLRLTVEGVDSQHFSARFGHAPMDVFGKEIDQLVQSHLLEWHGTSLRLTRRGRCLGNQVFLHFVD